MSLAEARLVLHPNNTEQPFKGKRGFLPVNLASLLRYAPDYGQDEVLLKSDVEFLGMRGFIAAMTGPHTLFEEARTPLGKAKTEIEVGDMQVKVRSLPLYLAVGFELRDINDYDTLMQHTPSFDLRDEQYYLKFDGETLRYKEEDGRERSQRTDLEEWFGEYQLPNILSGDRLLEPVRYRDGSENRTPVVLPYNIAALREGVNLTMITKPTVLNVTHRR